MMERTDQQFWPRLMMRVITPKYLEIKEQKKVDCVEKAASFEQFKECYERKDKQLQLFMLRMEYFKWKYNTCMEEGMTTDYKPAVVRKICTELIIKTAQQSPQHVPNELLESSSLGLHNIELK